MIVIPFCGSIAVLCLGVKQLHLLVISCTSFVSWIPVVNPLCTMYFIKPYRRAIVKYKETVAVSRTAVQPSAGGIQSH